MKDIINLSICVFILIIATTGQNNCMAANVSKISDPAVVGSIKEGVTTKGEVRRLFGDPQSISTGNKHYDGTTESWSYSYTKSKGYGKGFLVSSGWSIVGDIMPYGMGIGTRALSSGTRSVANDLVYDGADKLAGNKGSYSLTIDFKGDVVINKRFRGSGSHAVASNLNTVKSSGVKPVIKKQQISVYTTYDSRIYHKRNCTEIDTADVISFPSSQQALQEGGIPCKICNP